MLKWPRVLGLSVVILCFMATAQNQSSSIEVSTVKPSNPDAKDELFTLQVDPHELDGQTPEQIRRTGQLPPTERLEWHTDIPLIVLGHGKPIEFPPPLAAKGAQIEANFLAADKDLASRSSHGQFQLAERSGHFIQIDQPELVSKSIHEVWDAAIDMHQ